MVICEGWPTMGADFGGVIALTPAVLWLLLRLSGVRITWPKCWLIGGVGGAGRRGDLVARLAPRTRTAQLIWATSSSG